MQTKIVNDKAYFEMNKEEVAFLLALVSHLETSEDREAGVEAMKAMFPLIYNVDIQNYLDTLATNRSHYGKFGSHIMSVLGQMK